MKLYYFDAIGRAECIRLLLTHAGVPFEDIRIKHEDWPKYKEKFELKQVPALEDNGRLYCQTIAILEYLGVKYGYLPKKGFDKLYKIMKIINTTEDIMLKVYGAATSYSPLDEAGKAKALEDLYNNSGPLFVGSIEKALNENGCKKFIVGKKYTIADFYLLGIYRSLTTHPELKAVYQKFVEKHPALEAYAQLRIKDFNHYYKVCKPKLYYFDCAGRAEMIRILLKYLKIDFEDIRIKHEDWGKEKTSGKFELQQVPALECEPCGIKLCQTDAIMQRVGARFGLFPTKKAQKLYKVLWWCNTLKDVMEGYCKVYLPIPEDKKKELMKNFYEKSLPTMIAAMEDRLKMNKCQCCLVGRKNTIADFYLIGVWRGFMIESKEAKDLLEKSPVLKTYIENKDKKF